MPLLGKPALLVAIPQGVFHVALPIGIIVAKSVGVDLHTVLCFRPSLFLRGKAAFLLCFFQCCSCSISV